MANSPAAASRGSSEFTERPGARGSTQGLSDDTPSIEYPVGCSPFFHTASDIEYYDRLFSNPKNFSSETECDIFHAQNGKTEWMENVNEAEILQHLSETENEQTPVLRVIFCAAEEVDDASYGYRLPLSKGVTLALLRRFQIPVAHFYRFFTYGTALPCDFASYNAQGQLSRIEFRYAFATDQSWLSGLTVYMNHDVDTRATTYIVEGKGRWKDSNFFKRRLMEANRPGMHGTFSSHICLRDPFMFTAITLEELRRLAGHSAERTGTEMHDAEDDVVAYTRQPTDTRSRSELERLTIQLHEASRLIDVSGYHFSVLSASLRRATEMHSRYVKGAQLTADAKEGMRQVTDVFNYISAYLECDVAYVNYTKARKDTAMNLVFNLVAQQDAATSVTIARDAKADSAAMKTIAILTMVFLPGTFLSSVFGMESLGNASWWLYVVLTVALTVIVLAAWGVWQYWARAGGWIQVSLGKVKVMVRKRNKSEEDMV